MNKYGEYITLHVRVTDEQLDRFEDLLYDLEIENIITDWLEEGSDCDNT